MALQYYGSVQIRTNETRSGGFSVPKSSKNAPLQFRAPDITVGQLNDLSKAWGENRSKVIIRCIERAWLNEPGISSNPISQDKGE